MTVEPNNNKHGTCAYSGTDITFYIEKDCEIHTGKSNKINAGDQKLEGASLADVYFVGEFKWRANSGNLFSRGFSIDRYAWGEITDAKFY